MVNRNDNNFSRGDVERKNGMNDYLARIRAFPATVRKGILALIAAWLWFLFSLYIYFNFTGELLWRLALTGVLICYFVMAVKNWARILSVLFSSMIGLYFIFAAVNFFLGGQTGLGIVAATIFTLFLISSIYLLLPESAQFFRASLPEQSLGKKM